MKKLLAEGRKALIGVVHLKPLPGSPRFKGDFSAVLSKAIKDALAYEKGGADALCIENFGDVPFTKGSIAPEKLTSMTAAGRAIREAVRLPIGFNVLRNDPHAALALCVTCNGSFVRVNVHIGVMLTDQGIIEGNAYETLRRRERLCPDVQIFADVHVKHAVTLCNQSIEDSARDTVERGLADALIISGTGTGTPAAVSDVQRVRSACPTSKILLGSGVSLTNIKEFHPLADGFIVGTSLKTGGQVANSVDVRRVASLAGAIH